jgi:hypothetical protein
MAKEKKQIKDEDARPIEETIDPYTGELEPVAEDADQFIEVVPEETNNREGENYLLNEETSMDSYAADANADAVAEQSAHFTDDKDIEDDFAERQKLAAGGRDVLEQKLEEHHSLSPAISGGDLDAAWEDANVSGDEAVGGSVSTPDQDIVEQLGEAAGLQYRDDEPLDYDRKVLARDRNRWELNPASADVEVADNEAGPGEDDEEEDVDELDELDELEEGDEYEEDLDELDELDELDDDEEEEEEDLGELGYEVEDLDEDEEEFGDEDDT